MIEWHTDRGPGDLNAFLDDQCIAAIWHRAGPHYRDEQRFSIHNIRRGGYPALVSTLLEAIATAKGYANDQT